MLRASQTEEAEEASSHPMEVEQAVEGPGRCSRPCVGSVGQHDVQKVEQREGSGGKGTVEERAEGGG